jgi:hypothetical protein
MAEKPGDDESPENKGRDDESPEKVRLFRVTMSAHAKNISVLEIGAPTTQVEPPPDNASGKGEAHNGAGGLPQATLFPYKRKK